MGIADRASLLPLAESIADGSAIDWDAAEAGASADDKAVVRQLRVLASLAGLHRRAEPVVAVGNWAHLTLLERLGGGTFGDVYRAWDRHLEREVALKLLRGAGDGDIQASRIASEGRLLARVRHPNVITVHGVDVHEGRVGLWMELVHGATLEQALADRGPFSAREAALVGIDLCRALAALHGAGLIHRDVKAQSSAPKSVCRPWTPNLLRSRSMPAATRLRLPRARSRTSRSPIEKSTPSTTSPRRWARASASPTPWR